MVEHSPFTIISRGTHLVGETRSRDELIIEGIVEGDVIGAKVVIKNGGRILGTVDCETLVIEPGGILDGNIRSTGFPDKQRGGLSRRRRLRGGHVEKSLPPPGDNGGGAERGSGDNDRFPG
jgi:hypothetical protein